MQYRDYYETLGVRRGATQDEIKSAYRKLARKHHPDVSKEAGADKKFKKIGEAYEVLKNPEKRAAYDQLGANWQAGQDFRPPPDWNEGFEFTGGYRSVDPSQFSDFFESLFGGTRAGGGARRRRSVRARGEDHHARISIDLEDSYEGATRTLTLRAAKLTDDGHVTTEERTLNVRIPKGIHQGRQIRLSGQGGPGVGGAKPGDLYLEVDIKPHPRYRVDGADVFLDLPVAPWEAALGASVKVPIPSGLIDLKIPPGSVQGNTLRLTGRGIPAKKPGDLYLVLQITLPPADTKEAKQAYEQMKEKLDFNPRAGLET